MNNINILLFYKFVEVENPSDFVEKHLAFCKKLKIFGKVLVGKEGINGSISGTKEQTEKYKEKLREDKKFSDIIFKEEIGKSSPFTKMSVRDRDEIIRMGKKIDMNNVGKYISPKEFLSLYDREDKNLIILDARNDYEWKVGKFKNSITPNIKTFREFPKFVESIKDKKDKKIVMYCTGGIRCEKASSYMIQQGFNDVRQLHGGIISFCQKFPNTVWDGKCFVFDKRLVSNINEDGGLISECLLCNSSCDLYRNCKNKKCDKFVIMCLDCEKKMNACCTDNCLREFRKQCSEKSFLKQGRRMSLVN